MTGFSLSSRASKQNTYNTAPLVSIFVRPSLGLKLRVGNSSIKSTCHGSRHDPNFSGILLPWMVSLVHSSGNFRPPGPFCASKKKLHDIVSFIHKEYQASGGSLKSCRRYVSVQSKRVDRRSCMFGVCGRSRTNSRVLTWPHLRNLFLKSYVKITSKTSSKATNHFEELRVTVIKTVQTNSSLYHTYPLVNQHSNGI